MAERDALARALQAESAVFDSALTAQAARRREKRRAQSPLQGRATAALSFRAPRLAPEGAQDSRAGGWRRPLREQAKENEC